MNARPRVLSVSLVVVACLALLIAVATAVRTATLMTSNRKLRMRQAPMKEHSVLSATCATDDRKRDARANVPLRNEQGLIPGVKQQYRSIAQQSPGSPVESSLLLSPPDPSEPLFRQEDGRLILAHWGSLSVSVGHATEHETTAVDAFVLLSTPF